VTASVAAAPTRARARNGHAESRTALSRAAAPPPPPLRHATTAVSHRLSCASRWRVRHVCRQEEAEEGEAPKGPPPQPEIPYLSPIDGSMWSCTTYMDGGPPVAVVRSLQWPGALCAYQLNPLGATGAEVNASLYVGYGLPMLMGPFVMEAPPPFESEPEEVVEQADMPLAEENKLFLEKEKARIAEEAAALPDEEA
jgi:hypothetical protein